jgi:hypothetical protein
VTAIGQNEGAKYGVRSVIVTLSLDQKPADDAVLQPLSLTTDDAGSGIATLKLSHKRGRHLVSATSSGAHSELILDTLFPENEQPSRARHNGGVTLQPGERIAALPYFAGAAALVLLAGFAYPYLPQLSALRPPGRPARRRARSLPAQRAGGYSRAPIKPSMAWQATTSELPPPPAEVTPVVAAETVPPITEVTPLQPAEPSPPPPASASRAARQRPAAKPRQGARAAASAATAKPSKATRASKVVRSAKPTVMARKKASAKPAARKTRRSG